MVSQAILRGDRPPPPVSLDRAAQARVRGYDDWAAAAVQIYCSRHGWPGWRDLAAFASALTRSPMSEVAWVESELGAGRDPRLDEYDRIAARYRWVRRFPRRRGHGPPLARQLASTGERTQIGLMLADEPWVIPQDVWRDPAYEGDIPPGTMDGEINWDSDGLLRRVDHEMLVIEAMWDPEARRQLDG